MDRSHFRITENTVKGILMYFFFLSIAVTLNAVTVLKGWEGFVRREQVLQK